MCTFIGFMTCICAASATTDRGDVSKLEVLFTTIHPAFKKNFTTHCQKPDVAPKAASQISTESERQQTFGCLIWGAFHLHCLRVVSFVSVSSSCGMRYRSDIVYPVLKLRASSGTKSTTSRECLRQHRSQIFFGSSGWTSQSFGTERVELDKPARRKACPAFER